MNSIELNKETVNISLNSLETVTQSVAEMDIIVPDTKPDIAKILQTDAYVVLSDKVVSQDKVRVSSVVHVTILYKSDKGAVCAMNTAIPLETVVALKGATEGMNVEYELEIKSLEDTVINSRKLNIKALVGISIRLSQPHSCDIITSARGGDYEMLNKTLDVDSLFSFVENDISIRENAILPNNKHSFNQILKTGLRIVPRETKAINNKIIVKGQLELTVLYLGDGADMPCQDAMFEIPFTEVIDAYGVDDNMQCDAAYHLKGYNVEVQEDSDGDSRIAAFTATISAVVKVMRQVKTDVLCDLYSTKVPLDVIKQTGTVDKFVNDNTAQFIVKEVINIPHEMPEISVIYCIDAKPIIKEALVAADKVMVSGDVEGYLHYISPSEDAQISKYKICIPFKQTMDVIGASEGNSANLKLSIQEATANVGLGWNVEVKLIMDCYARVQKPSKFDYVKEVTQLEEEEKQDKRSCSITVYFVQKDDTIWDIAKRYRVKMDSLLDANDLQADAALKPGAMLMI